MSCHDHQDRFSDYLSGELDEDLKTPLHEHLAGCLDCRERFEELMTVWVELGTLPEGDPPPALRNRFYAMLEQEKAGQKARPPVLERFNGWIAGFWPRRPAAQMATALACLIVGVLGGNLLRPAPDPIPRLELAGVQQEIADLRETVSITLMNQASSTQRLQGIQYSARVESPNEPLIETLLDRLRYDPNVNIRLAAIDALYLFSDRPAVRDALVAGLSEQTSPLVQIALIDLLVEARESRSLEALRRILRDEGTNENVRQYTETRMQELL